MKYLITGGSGFIGSNLCASLKDEELFILTRNIDKTTKSFKKLGITNAKFISSLNNFTTEVDVVINLAGAGIFDKRWSKKYKQILIDSRVNTTKEIYNYVVKLANKPRTFITGSAVGIYGEKLDNSDENTSLGSGFASEICQRWESEAHKIEGLGINTCYLRFGVVIGNGGMMKKTLPTVKLGLGAYFGSGEQYMPWVSIADITRVITFCIKNNKSGTYNVVSQQQITNKEFMQILAKTLGKKIYFSFPKKVLALLFGQSAKEVLLISQKIIPQKLINDGYTFKHNSLEQAFADLL